MNCYSCGAELSEKDFCTACGADVTNYKKVYYMSRRLYNDGLEKANVRDLSGAIIALRESLKFDKTNVEARNLLGLVYFEMGDVVGALMEWVISKNFRSRKNLADDYIEAVQSNPARLDAINQSIKKYNQALKYCYQDSKDLAVIQLKKVLSQNPRLVQGHLLLALLYLDGEQWGRARREIDRVLAIDVGNTMALTYRKYIEDMTAAEEEAGAQSGRKKKNDHVRAAESAITYQSGNDVIIQPADLREPRGASSILNIIIGLIIGMAVCYFLIMPAKVQMARNNMNEELKKVGDNSDDKSAKIQELEQSVASLEAEKQRLQSSMEEYTGENGQSLKVDSLLETARLYIDNPEDISAVADSLYGIDREYVESLASDSYKQLYNKLMAKVGPQAAGQYYEKGTASMNQSDFTTAVETLQKAWYFASVSESPDPEILYSLAQAYQSAGEADQARATYQKVVSSYPESTAAQKATERLSENGDETPPPAASSEQTDGEETGEQAAGDDTVREGPETDTAETREVMQAAG